MFSLPMIAPRPDATLWPSLHNNHTAFEDTQSQSPPSHNQRRPTSHHGPHHNQNLLLSSLNADENTISQRKLNVRRFGAGWLRPPGVTKTLQAMRDEELEKEEQEMMQRREQVMMDLAAAQQDAANEEQRERGEMEEEAGAGEVERDLDDEVPEAESSMSDSSADADSSSAEEEEHEEEEDEEEEEEGGSEVSGEVQEESTVPFNEDSFIEGSMMEAEVSHMLEMEEAEMAGVLQDERDLDDDVPEAGSYEHTDSELEDSSDVDNSVLPPGLASARSRRSTRRRSSGRRSSGRRSSGLPGGMTLGAYPTAGRVSLGVDLGNGRSSFGMDGSSSFLEGSSFLRSSPAGAAAANRGTLRDRFLGAARGGGSAGGGGRRA
ncbi:anaphase-promoting subunit 15 mnd2 [Stemphylium lycopersici]|nr:anaphase-promoting subunit 15 mnd2 [Stemphylium lycopersici]